MRDEELRWWERDLMQDGINAWLVACLIENLEKLCRAGCIYWGTFLVRLLAFPPPSVALLDFWGDWLVYVVLHSFLSEP